MYSRNRAWQSEETHLPARYSGVRFRRDKRSDGRDVAVEIPIKEPPLPAPSAVKEEETAPEEKRGTTLKALSSLFGNVEQDDILLAALIIVLAGEGAEENREAILLLILLLCVR